MDMGLLGMISKAVETVSDGASDLYQGAKRATADVMPAVGDALETVGNAASPYAEDLGKSVLKMPGVGEVVNVAQTAYHVGAGAYDGVTGDRDGAIGHFAQGGTTAVGMIPGVSEVMGATDQVMGPLGGLLKTSGLVNPDAVPQSLADVASNTAVEWTNTIFGKDDSNWIAPGDAPTGTRRGEIGAGVDAVGETVLNAGTFGVGPLLQSLGVGPDASERQNFYGDAVGDLFGTKKDAKTLGAQGNNPYQKQGQETHDLWTGLFD